MIHEDWDVGQIGDNWHPSKYDIALLELEVCMICFIHVILGGIMVQKNYIRNYYWKDQAFKTSHFE